MKGLVEIKISFNDDPYETTRTIVEVQSEKTSKEILTAYLDAKYGPDPSREIADACYVDIEFGDFLNTYTVTEFIPSKIA